VRKTKALDFLRPDGKAQVTVEYENDVPKRVTAVVVSTQHSESIGIEDLRRQIARHVVEPVLPGDMIARDLVIHVNPTGRFVVGTPVTPPGRLVVGGPRGETGRTGRKIIADTSGGRGHHGGGAFSGKDPTKVARAASYMARHIAKNVVAAGLADRAEVQIAYATGVPEPVSVLVDTYGTCKVPEEKLSEIVLNNFPLKPREIIKYLDLLRPIYAKTAAFGHFGRTEPEFTWERTD